jgi:2-keto-4-pentenoate hydratase/2-oxohepta-3-ene-1,7-dioic acid hydratase in catechol pathway
MKLRRLMGPAGPALQIETASGWVRVDSALASIDWGLSVEAMATLASDMLALLSADPMLLKLVGDVARTLPPQPAGTTDGPPMLPFEPRSYRDFMLYEQHAIDAARGYVRHFMPKALPAIRAFESLTGKAFPSLKPRPLWYKQPIYYMGNHLSFAPTGSTVAIPSYSKALDYELELGFVITKPLLNATPEEAEAAIGGFVVFNDLSARDIQKAEMDSGFGPQKAKHFKNLMSAELVTADEILPRWTQLTAGVELNDRAVARLSSANPKFTLGQALAHVCRDEQLHPGEFFATGTWPGGSGMEFGRMLQRGDELRLTIDQIGCVECKIV